MAPALTVHSENVYQSRDPRHQSGPQYVTSLAPSPDRHIGSLEGRSACLPMTTTTAVETILAVLKSVMKISQVVAGQGDEIIITMPIDQAEAKATPIEM